MVQIHTVLSPRSRTTIQRIVISKFRTVISRHNTNAIIITRSLAIINCWQIILIHTILTPTSRILIPGLRIVIPKSSKKIVACVNNVWNFYVRCMLLDYTSVKHRIQNPYHVMCNIYAQVTPFLNYVKIQPELN